jgi:hypothetical protein
MHKSAHNYEYERDVTASFLRFSGDDDDRNDKDGPRVEQESAHRLCS